MTVNAVLIDDEIINIKNLTALLDKHCGGIKIVGSALNAIEARELINTTKPDIVFLDIEMPGENGFDLLMSIPEPGFEVVFVSAYDTYGIRAIKFSALDYLLKPIDVAELKSCVDRIEESVRTNRQNKRLTNLLNLLDQAQPDQGQKIALPVQKETYLVTVRDILRCESSNNYTRFYLVNGIEYLISRPIYEFDELLTPYGFVRCHQSHLVNRTHVSKILNEDSGYLVLGNDAGKVPISKQKKTIVKALLGKI